MKKVLIIIGKLHIGGAERIGRDIGFFADPKHFEIHYLVFGPEIGGYEQELTDKGCRIVHMNPPSRNHAVFYRNLTALLRREKYDVVHAHTMFSSGWAMMAGRACGVPVRIAHSHSIREPERRGFLKNAYEKTMRQLILRHATHYAACGQRAGNWLFGGKAFQEKGILIYNGIELGRFAFDAASRQEIRQQLGLEDRFVIGHAGHMAPVKNQSFLLELMPEILNKKPNAVLLLLGDGNDRLMLEERVRALGLEKNVIMTGNVGHVEKYLSAMDVFVFPSLYEGMPLAMMEAQANGLPCIISDRIPEDVCLTNLITRLPLDGQREAWIDGLCGAGRKNPERYLEVMQATGLNTSGMLARIYGLYEG